MSTSTICAVAPDRTSVYRYDGSGSSWTNIGGPGSQSFIQVWGGGWGLVATAYGPNEYSYSGESGEWELISPTNGPASEGGSHIVTDDTVYKLLSTVGGGDMYEFDGFDGSEPSWSRIRGPARQAWGGSWGLVAQDSQTFDAYRYTGNPGDWDLIAPDSYEFAVGADTVYRLATDKNTVYQYDGFGNTWTPIGGAASSIAAGGWGLVATAPPEANFDLYAYTGNPGAWRLIGGPRNAFLEITDETVYGLAFDNSAVYRYDGKGTSWTRIGGPAYQIAAIG
ncbi:hypothetical protein [Streptomyces palmae]|uniref:Tachylectin 2 domain-containing protein n=1 Tax=Streptomyces palmae TaxID=1701085 RepID=A0A4Z0HAL3_9ACTN|nr:hypothetical protein [Streptomyces palmae]TGB06935.1 hypothetical protein E4099_17795 [Streptomyces palmae]